MAPRAHPSEFRRMMAEILGRRTGDCKGKSGSLHVSVKELGAVLTSTIVGGERLAINQYSYIVDSLMTTAAG